MPETLRTTQEPSRWSFFLVQEKSPMYWTELVALLDGPSVAPIVPQLCNLVE